VSPPSDQHKRKKASRKTRRSSSKRSLESPLKSFLDHTLKEQTRYLAVRDEVSGLSCFPEGISRLGGIAVDLRKELPSSVNHHLMTIAEMNAQGVEGLIDFVHQRLILHYCQPPATLNEIRKKAQKELEEFRSFLQDLADPKGKKGEIDMIKVFQIASLVKPEISCHLVWETWERKYQLVVDQAKQFKKSCLSHRNRISSYTELSGATLTQIEGEYRSTFELLDSIIADPFLKEWRRKYAKRGEYAKKSSVWLPILKELEKKLAPFFQSKYEWEKQRVIPGKVYNNITQILHFCYPDIWDLNPNTTASIKSRCQQLSSRSS